MAADETNSDGLTIALVGATGAVGSDLLSALAQSTIPVAAMRLFASPGSNGTTVEWRERKHRVQSLPPAASASAAFEGVDLVILAAPPNVTRELAPVLSEEGIATIDIGGALADHAPLMVPAVSLDPLSEFLTNRVICSPSGPAVVLSTVIGHLANRGAQEARGTVLLSASAAGRQGTEELSQQVVSMFNHRDPPRKVFPTGLAFDINPTVGTDADGWTTVERRLALEVGQLVGWEPDQATLGVALVPVFSGVCASLCLTFDHPVNVEDIQSALDEIPGVCIANPLPGPRRIVGESTIYVGRIRGDSDAHRVHFWVIADNLRCGATANVMAIATALWSDGYL